MVADKFTQTIQRRAHFRVKYPVEHAPRMIITGTPYVVIDISERGARLGNPMRRRLPDDIFKVFVWLHEGEPLKVLAKVVRLEQANVALYFLQEIPYNRILSEQVYLKKLSQK